MGGWSVVGRVGIIKGWRRAVLRSGRMSEPKGQQQANGASMTEPGEYQSGPGGKGGEGVVQGRRPRAPRERGR